MSSFLFLLLRSPSPEQITEFKRLISNFEEMPEIGLANSCKIFMSLSMEISLRTIDHEKE